MFWPIPPLSAVQWLQFSILQKWSMGRVSKNSAMLYFIWYFKANHMYRLLQNQDHMQKRAPRSRQSLWINEHSYTEVLWVSPFPLPHRAFRTAPIAKCTVPFSGPICWTKKRRPPSVIHGGLILTYASVSVKWYFVCHGLKDSTVDNTAKGKVTDSRERKKKEQFILVKNYKKEKMQKCATCIKYPPGILTGHFHTGLPENHMCSQFPRM